MAENLTIKAQAREVTGKQVRGLRAHGLTPGNISGGARPSVAIQIPTTELHRLLKGHGAGLVRIQVDSGAAETTLLNRIERNPITSAVLHVDFRRIRLDQVVRTHVAVRLSGEAPAVRLHGGVLLHVLDTVEVESLPTNIPESLTLDITPLNELNSSLTVADIQSPHDVKVLTTATEPVVTVKAPRIEAEPAAETAASETTPATTASEGETGGASE